MNPEGALGDPIEIPSRLRRRLLVALISPMPELSLTDHPPSGVARFTQRLLESFDRDWEVAAIAQTNGDPTSSAARVRILPTWRPGWACVLDVTRRLRHLHPQVIHAQHELRLYGGITPTLALILSLNWFRWRGAGIVITLHGVPKLADIEAQNILVSFPGVGRLTRTLMKMYLALILRSCDAVIVHSDVFYQRLAQMFPTEASKLHVIQLGADSNRAALSSRNRTRDSGSRPHAIAFGFLTSYKLPELILDASEQGLLNDFSITLSVARNPRAASARLEARYQALRARASLLEGIDCRGYLSDAELDRLLRQADVLILPYTACVAASGVSALADGAGVPVAYSRPLEELFGKSRASFALTPESLSDAVRAVVQEGIEVRMPHAPWAEVATATFDLWQATWQMV